MLLFTLSEIKAINKITMVGVRVWAKAIEKCFYRDYFESMGDGLWHTVNSQVTMKNENVLVKLSEHITW